MPGSLSPQQRLELIKLVSALPSTQFDQLVFAMQPPSGVIPDRALPQGTRSAALLDWTESATGPGLSSLEQILKQIAVDSPEPNPQITQIDEALSAILQLLKKNQSPKYDLRGAQFKGGFAETVRGNQIGINQSSQDQIDLAPASTPNRNKGCLLTLGIGSFIVISVSLTILPSKINIQNRLLQDRQGEWQGKTSKIDIAFDVIDDRMVDLNIVYSSNIGECGEFEIPSDEESYYFFPGGENNEGKDFSWTIFSSSYRGRYIGKGELTLYLEGEFLDDTSAQGWITFKGVSPNTPLLELDSKSDWLSEMQLCVPLETPIRWQAKKVSDL